VLTNTSL